MVWIGHGVAASGTAALLVDAGVSGAGVGVGAEADAGADAGAGAEAGAGSGTVIRIVAAATVIMRVDSDSFP